MENLISNYIGELVVGIALALLAWGFKAWATRLDMLAKKFEGMYDGIIHKLNELTQEFHTHRVEVEHRVTRVETKVDLHREVSDSTNRMMKEDQN